MLKQAIHAFLQQHDLLGRDRATHFIVAYSGGRDSTALLHALAELARETGDNLTLTAAYYWHPWRPLQRDIATVQAQCNRLNLQWVMLTPDLTLPHSEAAARQDRYNQLARLGFDLDATAILTAHHQDDQIETILFRLLRGTGLDGMTGIPPVRELPVPDTTIGLPLARPLLAVPREEIDAYVQANQLAYVDDPTNTQTRYKRNYLRHELLPKLKEVFPQAGQALLSLSSLVEGDLEIIDTKVDDIWNDLFDSKSMSLDEVRFCQLLRPLQRRIIRRFLEAHRQEHGLQRVEQAIDFILAKNRDPQASALFSLGNQRFMAVYRNRVTLETIKKHAIAPVRVPVPSAVSHLGLKATLTITPLSPEERLKPVSFADLPPGEIYADLSRFDGQELILRTRQNGDRIRPLGMDEPIRLKKFFMNRRISRFNRDEVPLLASDSQVLWAVGVGISEEIRVKDRPTHRITLEKRETP